MATPKIPAVVTAVTKPVKRVAASKTPQPPQDAPAPKAIGKKVASKTVVKAPAKAPAKAVAVAATKKARAVAAIDPTQRAHYIEVAAFYIAERRGFAPGNPVQDYLDAAAEIDRLLAAGHFKK